MKVCIAFPPLESKQGIPLLSQNRQFQWSRGNTVVYPVIPASAATLLKQKGHDVCWLDGIAEGWSFETWFEEMKQFSPDLIFIESKTPVIKQHWKIVGKIKKLFPKVIVVLAGDHVTALPEESLENSRTDYIISGGNYETALLDIVRLTPKEKIINTRNSDLNALPLIDRKLTKWQLYAYKNGNYKYTPGTYIMAGRDCWWRQQGGCTFCSWTTIFPQFSVRDVESVLDEVGSLIDLGVKEIFDDTGTFPIGKWLADFCQGMIDRGYNKRVVMGCNMRFGYLDEADYALMARANFRFLLFGLESANQDTLDRLNKGTRVNEIEQELGFIKLTGKLEPHITCMIGYPWETKEDAERTVKLCKRYFTKGLINSLQATVIIPYPGTTLFREASAKGWLKTTSWERYDMKSPILISNLSKMEVAAMTKNIYLSAITPQFILKTIRSIRQFSDVKLLLSNSIKYVAKYIDFIYDSD